MNSRQELREYIWNIELEEKLSKKAKKRLKVAGAIAGGAAALGAGAYALRKGKVKGIQTAKKGTKKVTTGISKSLQSKIAKAREKAIGHLKKTKEPKTDISTFKKFNKAMLSKKPLVI